jgi:uncharacterized protein (TIGR03435 family)
MPIRSRHVATSERRAPVERPVVDRSGLAGNFDFQLRFDADSGGGNGSPSNLPSIYTALQEQLGLSNSIQRARRWKL